MNEEKNSPNKNIVQNELVTKNKRLFLSSFKPINNIQVTTQFRNCNRRYFDKNEQKEEEKKVKGKIMNINLMSTNLLRLNNASKKIISQSKEKINKNIKEHEENLKKIRELEKIIEELNKNDVSLENEINKLKTEENNLQKDLNTKEEEEKELNDELNNLKNINDEKNREYLHLMQSNQERQIGNNNNNANSNNIPNQGNNNNPIRNNTHLNRMEITELLNNYLRIRGNAHEENNEENVNNISEDKSINYSNLEINDELGEDLGPPMTFIQIDALPVEKYPRRDTYDEKCILCGFNLCYNDSITKLQCQHIFHKECLGNFLINRQASKCPSCKVSLI